MSLDTEGLFGNVVGDYTGGIGPYWWPGGNAGTGVTSSNPYGDEDREESGATELTPAEQIVTLTESEYDAIIDERTRLDQAYSRGEIDRNDYTRDTANLLVDAGIAFDPNSLDAFGASDQYGLLSNRVNVVPDVQDETDGGGDTGGVVDGGGNDEPEVDEDPFDNSLLDDTLGENPLIDQPDVFVYDSTNNVFVSERDGQTYPAGDVSDIAITDGGRYTVRAVENGGVVAEHVVDQNGNTVATVEQDEEGNPFLVGLNINVFDTDEEVATVPVVTSNEEDDSDGTDQGGTGTGVDDGTGDGVGDGSGGGTGGGVVIVDDTDDGDDGDGTGGGSGDGDGDGTGDGDGGLLAGTGLFERGGATQMLFNRSDFELDNIPEGLFRIERRLRRIL